MWNMYLKYTMRYKVTKQYPTDVPELMYQPDTVTLLRLRSVKAHCKRTSFYRGSHYDVTTTEIWGGK